MPDFVLNRAHEYVDINEPTAGILGYPPDIYLGKTPYTFMPPKEQDRVKPMVASAMVARVPWKHLLTQHLDVNGEPVQIVSRAWPIFDDRDNWLGYEGEAVSALHTLTIDEVRVVSAMRESSSIKNAVAVIMRKPTDWLYRFVDAIRSQAL